MTKQFPIEGVLGVYTGFVLKDGGFSEIHEVMDHLYPGIMTLGCAEMASRAKAEIAKQLPALSDLPECTSQNWEGWLSNARVRLGDTLPVCGPVPVYGPVD